MIFDKPETEAQRAQYEAYLVELQRAYVVLAAGNSVVSVTDQHGQKVDYTPARQMEIRRLISELRLALGKPPVVTQRPIKFAIHV